MRTTQLVLGAALLACALVGGGVALAGARVAAPPVATRFAWPAGKTLHVEEDTTTDGGNPTHASYDVALVPTTDGEGFLVRRAAGRQEATLDLPAEVQKAARTATLR